MYCCHPILLHVRSFFTSKPLGQQTCWRHLSHNEEGAFSYSVAGNMVNQSMDNKCTRMFVTKRFATTSNFLLVLLIAASTTSSMAGPVAGPFYGDGTFYGESEGGHCSLYNVGWRDLPWARGIDATVAMNKQQYEGSRACGSCIRFRTQNPDCTTCGQKSQWVTREWKYAIVADECPECGYGAIDIAKSGDGRWKFEWEILQCNVGSSGFRYTLVGSNPYYIKLMISNARYAVQAVNVHSTQGWIELARQPDNAFVGQASTFQMPLKMIITSRFQEVVYDDLNLPSYSGSVQGFAQFPDKGYTTVGQGGIETGATSE